MRLPKVLAKRVNEVLQSVFQSPPQVASAPIRDRTGDVRRKVQGDLNQRPLGLQRGGERSSSPLAGF
jgi:hypothetical protein